MRASLWLIAFGSLLVNNLCVGQRAHDQSLQQLRQTYNQNIRSLQRVERPLGSKGSSGADALGIRHQGVVATLDDGRQFLVHKGRDYGGSGGNTVVTDARHMRPGNWQPVGAPVAARPGYRFGEAVRDGGANYRLIRDNCYHGASRIMQNGQNRNNRKH